MKGVISKLMKRSMQLWIAKSDMKLLRLGC